MNDLRLRRLPDPVRDVREETVTVESGDDGTLVMWPDGTVRAYVDVDHARRAIERAARATQKATGADAVLTRVEFRGVELPTEPVN